MATKLPTTFQVRQRGRNQTLYVATAVPDREDIYELTRPGYPERQRLVGKIKIVPAGKGKQDGRGYTIPVHIGKSMNMGDAYWKPARPIAEFGPMVEGVSVQRATHPDTSQLVYRIQLALDTQGRSASFHLLPKIQARQLYAQLHQYFGPRHERVD